MRNRIELAMIVLFAAAVGMGAKGCEVWAETVEDTHTVGSESLAVLHNDSGNTVYLSGCQTFNYEKLEEGNWVDRGPNLTCVWEGIIRSLQVGRRLETLFTISEAGTWRLRYDIGLGCLEDVPMSEADCESFKTVLTPSFEVKAVTDIEPSCADLSGVDFGMCEMVLGWALIDGACRLVSGCSAQQYGFYATETACLSACAESCTQWSDLYDSTVGTISSCTSAAECVDLPGTSCGCTRNLVVNQSADLTSFWEIFKAMGEAGCGIVTVCDCPQADGFVCQNGHCQWNYL